MPPEQRAARVHIVLEKAYRLETMVNEFFEITKYKSQKNHLVQGNHRPLLYAGPTIG